MIAGHYGPLVFSYAVALLGWTLANRYLNDVWPAKTTEPSEHPWKEFGIAVAGAAGIILIGQLWSAGIRFPETGSLGTLFSAINQVLIFSPILLVPIVRGHSREDSWLPKGKILTRLLVGFVLSVFAVSVYSFMRLDADEPLTLIGRVWSFGNFDKMVQVFLEDLTIAILFVRLVKALDQRWAIVIVACLFAAGHIPAMLSGGATIQELGNLLIDASLGVAVISVLTRSRDIVWFWFVHFSLDMLQFGSVNGTG